MKSQMDVLKNIGFLVTFALLTSTAFANPTIVPMDTTQIASAGSASFGSNSTADHMQIIQTTPRAVINWKDFGIDSGQSVTFIQPSANSVMLNRVVGNQSSYIAGQLSATGTLILINDSGIHFWGSSKVDVASLILGAVDMNDGDFMKGDYKLYQRTKNSYSSEVFLASGAEINIPRNGLVALIGEKVGSTATIKVNMERVALPDGHVFAAEIYGDHMIYLVSSDNLSKFEQVFTANNKNDGDKLGLAMVMKGRASYYKNYTVEQAKKLVNDVVNMTKVRQANVATIEEDGVVLK